DAAIRKDRIAGDMLARFSGPEAFDVRAQTLGWSKFPVVDGHVLMIAPRGMRERGRAGTRVRLKWRGHSSLCSIVLGHPGEMAEWLKAHAWKACIGETLSRVRIPLSPPS